MENERMLSALIKKRSVTSSNFMDWKRYRGEIHYNILK